MRFFGFDAGFHFSIIEKIAEPLYGLLLYEGNADVNAILPLTVEQDILNACNVRIRVEAL